MSDDKKVHVDLKKIGKVMTDTLSKGDVNKEIGEKAAEMYIEGMAMQIASSNIQDYLRGQVGVPTGMTPEQMKQMAAMAGMSGKKPGPGGIVRP